MDLEVVAAKMMADAGGPAGFQRLLRAGGRRGVQVRAVHLGERARSCTGCRRAKRVLKPGDIVSIDTGVQLDGYYGDSAITVPGRRGERGDAEAAGGDAGVAGAGHRAGAGRATACSTFAGRWSGTSRQTVFRWSGSTWDTASGRKLHEEPQVPNYVDRKNENPRLKEGMVLAIEPMVNAGKPECMVARGPLDGGDQGRFVFGALRALRGGDVERAVGADPAVSGRRTATGRRSGRWSRSCPAPMYRVELESRQQVLAHAVGTRGTEFCPAAAGRSGARWSFRRTI